MLIYRSENSNKEIVIGFISGRKKPCLGIREGNTMTKVASFNGDDERDLFVDTLLEFLGISEIRSEV